MHYLIAFALTLSFPASTIFSSESNAGNAGLFLTHESIGKPTREAVAASIMGDDSLIVLYQRLDLMKYELSYDVFRYGMTGYNTLLQEGKLTNKNLLTIIDFTKPSTAKRFYTIDLAELKVKFHTYVSHGRNTGENEARSFSNTIHSNQSSLGFFMTGETYVGSKGYSLKLDGLEEGYNTNARERAVVIHEADYVSETWIRKYGRLGRSQGCPALPKGLSKEIINVIKNQTLVFAYYHDKTYLQHSAYLHYLEQFISNNTLVTPGLGVKLQ